MDAVRKIGQVDRTAYYATVTLISCQHITYWNMVLHTFTEHSIQFVKDSCNGLQITPSSRNESYNIDTSTHYTTIRMTNHHTSLATQWQLHTQVQTAAIVSTSIFHFIKSLLRMQIGWTRNINTIDQCIQTTANNLLFSV